MKSKTQEDELNQIVGVIEKQLRHMKLMLNVAEHRRRSQKDLGLNHTLALSV